MDGGRKRTTLSSSKQGKTFEPIIHDISFQHPPKVWDGTCTSRGGGEKSSAMTYTKGFQTMFCVPTRSGKVASIVSSNWKCCIVGRASGFWFSWYLSCQQHQFLRSLQLTEHLEQIFAAPMVPSLGVGVSRHEVKFVWNQSSVISKAWPLFSLKILPNLHPGLSIDNAVTKAFFAKDSDRDTSTSQVPNTTDDIAWKDLGCSLPVSGSGINYFMVWHYLKKGEQTNALPWLEKNKGCRTVTEVGRESVWHIVQFNILLPVILNKTIGNDRIINTDKTVLSAFRQRET